MNNHTKRISIDPAIAKSGFGDAFDALVAEEIRKGCPASVAGQRSLLPARCTPGCRCHSQEP